MSQGQNSRYLGFKPSFINNVVIATGRHHTGGLIGQKHGHRWIKGNTRDMDTLVGICSRRSARVVSRLRAGRRDWPAGARERSNSPYSALLCLWSSLPCSASGPICPETKRKLTRGFPFLFSVLLASRSPSRSSFENSCSSGFTSRASSIRRRSERPARSRSSSVSFLGNGLDRERSQDWLPTVTFLLLSSLLSSSRPLCSPHLDSLVKSNQIPSNPLINSSLRP